jgi:hypothetical protein
MKKIIILLGIILMNGMLFSCSNDEDQELDIYQQNIELFGTGGEEEQIPPPPIDPDDGN